MTPQSQPTVILRSSPWRRAPAWLRFLGLENQVTAFELAEVAPALAVISGWIDRGVPVAGFVSYEGAPALDPTMVAHAPRREQPILWFGAFDGVQSSEELAAVLTPPERRALEGAPPRRYNARPAVTASEHREATETIRRAIARGDVYQVNLTYLCNLIALEETEPATGSSRNRRDQPALELFVQLLGLQDAPFAGCITHPDFEICSASPELFFEVQKQRVIMRPMKGTAARGRFLAEDHQAREELFQSEKDRAENLMIVDMVRNDLGRIANPGSVEVNSLFDIETYRTLHQMTSTVSGQCNASFPELLAALFPCASVTGAPRFAAMKAIRDLEAGPRAVYTGTLGYWLPGRQAQWNVAIRTATRTRTVNQAGKGSVTAGYSYGVGSGIVWDSSPTNEWEECRTKSQITRGRERSFELFETMLWRPHRGVRLLEEHLARLRESCCYFDYPYDEREVLDALWQHTGSARTALRLRLLVSEAGVVRLESTPFEPSAQRTWRVALARGPVDESDRRLFHKTTDRRLYEHAAADFPEVSEVLLYNRERCLTEGTISNVALLLDHQWVTPARTSGLLAGTLRARLLERERLIERPVTLEEAATATDFVLMNSVRGLVRVRNQDQLRHDLEGVGDERLHELRDTLFS